MLDVVLKVLNESLAADEPAIRALVNIRVPCNKALADHPTIEVGAVGRQHSENRSECPLNNPENHLGMGGGGLSLDCDCPPGFDAGPMGLINGIVRAMGLPTICYEADDETGQVKAFKEYKWPQENP